MTDTNIENIYSSVPEELLIKNNDELNYRKPIIDFLKQRKGKFFTAREIAKELGYPTTGTQIDMRKEITLLLEIDKEPIMAMTKGFSYVDNKAQMNFYAEQLTVRLQGLQRRIKLVKEIADNMEELR